MNHKYHLSSVLAVLLVAVILSLSTGTFALAQDGTTDQEGHRLDENTSSLNFQFAVPGGPGFLMVPASAFVPKSDNIVYSRPDGTSLFASTSSAPDGNFDAPVFLPQGATVTKVVMYYYDNDSNRTMSLHLLKFPLPGDTSITMAYITSADSQVPFYAEDTTIQENPIDNQAYAYALHINMLGASPGLIHTFKGARIDYSYPTYLPAIQR